MAADEFAIIRDLFAPLAKNDAARGLADDVAVLAADGAMVVSTDTIVEGVHFLSGDPMETVAKKALRVNVSDIAAKGAKPIAAMLNLTWPDARSSDEIAAFAGGLAEDLACYEIALIGGDTTRTPGPLTVSITLMAKPIGARTPSRADAQVGDQVWVTGLIGKAFLGLMPLTEEPAILGASPGDQVDETARRAMERYRLPEPPAAFAPVIAEHARASMDVSDGLIADAEKLAVASGVAIRIDADAVPLSTGGEAYVAREGKAGLMRLLNGGDDYQALFTAKPEARGAIQRAGRELGINVALIGDVTEGSGVKVIGADGRELHQAAGGYRHQLGR